MRTSLFLIFISVSLLAFSTVWQVGPAHTYTMPGQVSTLVADGDTVDIDAGVYNSDVAQWTAHHLLLRGVGGTAHMKSNGNAYGGKAIWVISGDYACIENIEFSGCTVPDNNGAGIRQEGHHLTVRNCYFHHNEMGILAGTVNPSNIVIEYCEFAHNGYGDGYSHNVYINHVDTLIFRYNYSHHSDIGHELKSRAHVNYVLYNRLSNELTGTASRCVDLPNGGPAFLIGNVIEQGPQAPNSNIIGYGLEGLTNNGPHEIYAINNTIVNNRTGGRFFQFNPSSALLKAYNNILAGTGVLADGDVFPAVVDTMSNIRNADINSFWFADASQYDYHLTQNSTMAINSATNPGMAGPMSLMPQSEYVHPYGQTPRLSNAGLDPGAYEYTGDLNAESAAAKENCLHYYYDRLDHLLRINYANDDLISYCVFDVAGRLMKCGDVKGQHDVQLNFGAYRTGMYLISVMTSGKNHLIRVIRF